MKIKLNPPTNALPGTKQKMRIMSWRCRHGLPLFHPGDKERSTK